jgi:uncharacterized protein YbaR (Trm112 family)
MPGIDPDFLCILCCPVSRCALVQDGGTLVSTDKETRMAYPILDGGIPVLLEEEGEALSPKDWESVMARNPSYD